MNQTRTFFGLLAALGLAACATPPGSVTRLDTNPLLSGGSYTSGGGLTVASTLRNQGGRTALCGVWSESRAQTPFTRKKAREVVASGSADLDGQRLVTGLGFMRKVPPGTEYAGIEAPCLLTDRPWQPGDAGKTPVIHLPQQVVYRDGGAVAGAIVTFRQTGPGALSGSLDLVREIFGRTPRIPLSASPAQATGGYSSGGTIRVAAELRQIGDQTYACGAWKERRGPSRHTETQAPEILARAEIRAGGSLVVRDLRFLRRAPASGALAGRSANCIATGRSWSSLGDAARDVAIVLPTHTVYRGPEGAITFRPGS